MAQQKVFPGINCFTVSRFGAPEQGIVLTEDPGPDALRPWEPYIAAGSARIHRDYSTGCETVQRGVHLMVYQVKAYSRTVGSGRTMSTLQKPKFDEKPQMVLKVNLSLPNARSSIVVGGRQLKLYVGVSGGTLLERDAADAVVKLEDGEAVTCFYFDGGVRVFRMQGTELVETPLGTEQMLKERIAQAKRDLEKSRGLSGDARDKREFSILMGMADLLNMTTRFDARGLGQQLRLSILREFFLTLEPVLLQLVHRRLTAILHQVDSALVSLLWKEAQSQGSSPATDTVIDMGAERVRREKARREKVQHDREVRLAMKGRSGQRTQASSGGKKQKK